MVRDGLVAGAGRDERAKLTEERVLARERSENEQAERGAAPPRALARRGGGARVVTRPASQSIASHCSLSATPARTPCRPGRAGPRRASRGEVRERQRDATRSRTRVERVLWLRSSVSRSSRASPLEQGMS